MSTTVSTVTLSYIIDQARTRAKYTRSNFVVSTELMDFARGSIRELYDLLVDSFETYRLVTIDPADIVLDESSQFELPADFYKLKGVDYQLQTNYWVTLKPIPWNERNRYAMSPGYGVLGYMLLGRQKFDDQVSYLQFLPEGSAPATSYRIFYVPKPAIPAAGSDKVDGIQGWEEFCIWDTCAYILSAASRDPSDALARKEQQRARILEMSSKRDIGMPAQQAIVDQDNQWPWFYRT